MEKSLSGIYLALVPLVGALVTLMTGLNSRLSAGVGSLAAVLVIHAAGLVVISVLLLATREKRRPGRIPIFYYVGGVIGVGTVFSANYAFLALGASTAVAVALLGQTLFSVVVDATGLLGRTRYPLSARRLPGIALAVLGVLIMTGNWRLDAPAMLAALAAGITPVLSFTFNSELGRRKGALHSTLMNYITGLATTAALGLIVLTASGPGAAGVAGAAVRAVMETGPILLLGGGTLGVCVVTAMNFIFPRVPAFSSTVLLYSGQALMGVAVDAVSSGAVDARKLVGVLVLLLGLALNALLQRGRQADEAAAKTAAGGGG